MFTFKKISLYDDKKPLIDKKLWAQIKNNRLFVYGIDSGPSVKSLLGADEYKFDYSFDEENTLKIYDALETENKDKEFESRFSGEAGAKNLRDFASEKGIVFQFKSY
ncbi:MAG: hypothetical protein LBV67_09070 [Streptococcaceae bacterium]|jgi:hypothetical protein|nr:hypothetical protein [Streptococcaceae bacterium]